MERFIEWSDVIRPTQSDMADPHILQHLQSGYHEVYGEYEEWVKSEGALREAGEAFRGAVRDYAARKGFEVVEPVKPEAGKRQVFSQVSQVVEAYLQYKDSREVRVALDQEGVVRDEYTGAPLARGGQLVKEVEGLLKDLLNSEEIKKAFAKLEEARRRNLEAFNNYREGLLRLALKVEHGEPLRGSCELCPRVVVKERP
jgi:hypothetical protein